MHALEERKGVKLAKKLTHVIREICQNLFVKWDYEPPFTTLEMNLNSKTTNRFKFRIMNSLRPSPFLSLFTVECVS